MRRNCADGVVLAVIAFVMTGCATASIGTSQTLHIGSKPDGADCKLTREGLPLGSVKTPGSLVVKRSRQPIDVVCTKEGYEEGRTILNSQTMPGAIGGPGLIGGLIAMGTLVDMASGADTTYNAANVTLLPLSDADKAAAAAPPAPASTPSLSASPVQQAASTVPPSTTSGTQASDPAPGLWACKLAFTPTSKGYVLEFSVAKDKRFTILNHNSEQAMLTNVSPLTLTATNPGNGLPMTITWNADNSMTVAGQSPKNPMRNFVDTGSCTKQ
jgi:hypothetical protein